ncbi:MAG: LysM peptidoglycan-binding domain-containing protein [Alphaproteobacteria bacterium]
MARVIVILALLFLITAGIFVLTRPPAGGGAADGRTTVALPAVTGGTVASAQDVVGRPSAGAAPALATAGIDNNGRASFTGTAAPGDRVAIVREKKVLGRARAEKDGSWSMSFQLPDVREGYKLTVRSERGDGSSVSGPQHASVNPPARGGGLPVIRIEVTEADAEVPLSTTAAGEEEPRVGIIIETVNADDQGGVRMAGRADPGATLRLEMAGAEAGAARVGLDGRWSLEAHNNTGVEVKAVRVVLLSASGRELDSSSLPLRLPAPVIASAGGASPTVAGPVAAAGQKGRWVKVRRGDSLWKLAERHYGSGAKWTRILKANRRRIKDPDLILVGWRLRLP